MLKIAPSILSADFSILKEEILRLDQSSADLIHIDVMDGHFVSNLTVGPLVVESIRKYTKKIFDTHLMISNPRKYLKKFIQAGSDIISVHIEIEDNIKDLLEEIKNEGKKACLVYNPDTSIEGIESYFPFLDQVLLMSVYPGFSGQKFIEAVLDKARLVREKINTSEYEIDLEIDGGVNGDNIHEIKKVGVDIAVVGNFLYKQPYFEKTILELKKA